MFRSAPLMSNCLMLFVVRMSSLDFTAKCSGVSPFVSYAFTFDPQATKYESDNSAPANAAQCRGVDFFRSPEFTSRPSFRKNANARGWSPYAATCNMFISYLFLAWMFAPYFNNNRIFFIFPWKEAKCRAVNPSSPLLCWLIHSFSVSMFYSKGSFEWNIWSLFSWPGSTSGDCFSIPLLRINSTSISHILSEFLYAAKCRGEYPDLS